WSSSRSCPTPRPASSPSSRCARSSRTTGFPKPRLPEPEAPPMIKSRVESRIAFVELARLDKKNALTSEMYGGLADAIAGADADAEVRAVLLHGSPECFCAGNDVGDFLKRPPLTEGSPSQRFFEAMQALRKPLVAAVGGPAVGIGTTMLLHCDFVYAAEDARFQLPFVPLGIVPEFGSTYLLPLI